MFDTEEYYGGTYESPLEEDEREDEEFDYGGYVDYYYDSYKEDMLMKSLEENDYE